MSTLSAQRPTMPNLAGKAVTKVVWRVNTAQENQNLDLSECQLMSIPDAIYHLMRNTVLLSCNLSFNVIRKIPSKFAAKFSNITELNVSHNHLSTLPEELCELQDLRRLDISHNDFFAMPRTVFKMPALLQLDARKNLISDVDVLRLKSTPALREVHLEENPLSPSCHQQLTELNSSKMAVHVSPNVEDEDDDDFDYSDDSGPKE